MGRGRGAQPKVDGAAAWAQTEALQAATAKRARLDATAPTTLQQLPQTLDLFSTVCEVLRHFWAAVLAPQQVRSHRSLTLGRGGGAR
jgi:hypothetical protein